MEILTREEWKEIQAMQEIVEEKRNIQEQNKKYKKVLRLKKSIKNNINDIILGIMDLISLAGIAYIIILLDTLLHY